MLDAEECTQALHHVSCHLRYRGAGAVTICRAMDAGMLKMRATYVDVVQRSDIIPCAVEERLLDADASTSNASYNQSSEPSHEVV